MPMISHFSCFEGKYLIAKSEVFVSITVFYDYFLSTQNINIQMLSNIITRTNLLVITECINHRQSIMEIYHFPKRIRKKCGATAILSW